MDVGGHHVQADGVGIGRAPAPAPRVVTRTTKHKPAAAEMEKESEDIVVALSQELGGKYLPPHHDLLTIRSRLQSENLENHHQAAKALNKGAGNGSGSGNTTQKSLPPNAKARSVGHTQLTGQARETISKFISSLQQSPQTVCEAGEYVSRHKSAEEVFHLAQIVVSRLHAWHSIDATVLMSIFARSVEAERAALLSISSASASASGIFSDKSWLRNLLRAFAQARPSSRKYADRIVQKPVQQLYKSWKQIRANAGGGKISIVEEEAAGEQFLLHVCGGVGAGGAESAASAVAAEFRKVPEELKCVLNTVVEPFRNGRHGDGVDVASSVPAQRVLLVVFFEFYIFPAIERYARGLAAKLLRRQQGQAAAGGSRTSALEMANAIAGTAPRSSATALALAAAASNPHTFPSFLLRQLDWLRTTLFDATDIREPRPRPYVQLQFSLSEPRFSFLVFVF